MKFNKGKKFKIMQITDIQEIPAVSPDTIALLEAAIETEKPDLVVYTGKLLNKAIDSSKAEADAYCTEQLRGGVLDAGYCVVDLIDIFILDFEADLVDELSYRHRHHLALALLNFRSLL